MERVKRITDRLYEAWLNTRDVWRRRHQAGVAVWQAWQEQRDIESDWWEPIVPGACWVCGDEAPMAYLDLGYQHMDCDWWPLPPDENGDVPSVKIVRGERVEVAPDEPVND